MSQNLYLAPHYKDYLRAELKNRQLRRSELARELKCQAAYVSQVLKGSSHFSLEQGAEINRAFQHSQDECRYFLLLLQRDRAGTQRLRDFYQAELTLLMDQRSVLKNRLGVAAVLSREQQMTYYSSWLYGAVHIATTLPLGRSLAGLAKVMGMSVDQIKPVVDFLIDAGLLLVEEGSLKAGEVRIHLGSDSPLIQRHHVNWRIKTIQDIEKMNRQSASGNLHYSSVVTLSRQDFAVLKEKWISLIEQSKDIIRQSQEEELVSFNLDVFKLSQS